MPDAPEPAYYRRREGEARALAGKAVDPQVARIHLYMADRYAARASAAMGEAARC